MLTSKFIKTFFTILDLVTPKDKKLISFAQNKGFYSDNARALFLHITESEQVLKAVWLCDSQQQADRIRADTPDAVVVLKNSLKGIMYAARASTFVFTHSLGDFRPFHKPSGRKIQLFLWHAISIKRYGLCKPSKPTTSKSAPKRRHIIASSSIDAVVNSACSGVSFHRTHITGLPRNDVLCNTPDSVPPLPKSLQGNCGHLVLYAPTYRDDQNGTAFFPFPDFDPESLAATLDQMCCTILMRPHINDLQMTRKIHAHWHQDSSCCQIVGQDTVPDVADLLPHIDAVITDYSSIYVDLLLRDVPAIFIPYDIRDYESTRGLLYDYNSITPGPKVFTQESFLQELSLALSGANHYGEHRYIIKNLLHQHHDGSAASNVSKTIRELNHL
ncbi:CDP-glycerol glycerophosphotransferase family protein [Halorhodospira halochloris]|uniref:CDP-glycerol glycerophosphotransferase family protein n=1 Tax=Halorhodospira halochloris TaxID=1052 RepID=UPI001EE80F5E|nr:CDP-glycerol glycerophosphotransferase family protein [Halorhodospira halochloris]MCG5549558.1 CDP-glycerol glycerophosphotransferase family protein [Halorhodospira halochloris]